MARTLLVIAWLLMAGGCTAQVREGTEGLYTLRPGGADGIGKWYMGREIAHTMHHAHAAWLDRPEREREERPEKMLARMKVAPTDVIADIGCGTGYHSIRLARMAPQGRVYAVDVQPSMLDSVFARSMAAGLHNVEPVLGSATDPKLPPQAIDKVLLVDVYHEFDHPHEMMQGIVAAMKPGALLHLVEFRGEDPLVPIKPLHKMTKEQAVRELEAAGLVWESSWNGLPWQHFLVFRKL
jgi:ubiquinone/menaquinone biosynthesis C-methylase UbiE